MSLEVIRAGENDTPDFSFQVSSGLTYSRGTVLYQIFLMAIENLVPGHIAEFGVYRGETSRELARALAFLGINKHLVMFDTCEGLPAASTIDPQDRNGKYASTEDEIIAIMHDSNGSPLDNYTLIKGLIEDTKDCFDVNLCFAHIDFDLYEPTRIALELCRKYMRPGGYIVVDDYGTEWTGVTRAFDEVMRQDASWRFKQAIPGQILAVKLDAEGKLPDYKPAASA